ncbi:hypothetical protein Pelo_9623 [Pelomyxa schiedti]|nr:hypothetical protein Pelo_9623 [Pelomyxa schiedti]
MNESGLGAEDRPREYDREVGENGGIVGVSDSGCSTRTASVQIDPTASQKTLKDFLEAKAFVSAARRARAMHTPTHNLLAHIRQLELNVGTLVEKAENIRRQNAVYDKATFNCNEQIDKLQQQLVQLESQIELLNDRLVQKSEDVQHHHYEQHEALTSLKEHLLQLRQIEQTSNTLAANSPPLSEGNVKSLPIEVYHKIMGLENSIVSTIRTAISLEQDKLALQTILKQAQQLHVENKSPLLDNACSIAANPQVTALESEIVDLQAKLDAVKQENSLMTTMERAKDKALVDLSQEAQNTTERESEMQELMTELEYQKNRVQDLTEQNTTIIAVIDALDSKATQVVENTRRVISFETWDRERTFLQTKLRAQRVAKTALEQKISALEQRCDELRSKIGTAIRPLPARKVPSNLLASRTRLSGSLSSTLDDRSTMRMKLKKLQAELALKRQASTQRDSLIHVLETKVRALSRESQSVSQSLKKEVAEQEAETTHLIQQLHLSQTTPYSENRIEEPLASSS